MTTGSSDVQPSNQPVYQLKDYAHIKSSKPYRNLYYTIIGQHT